MKATRRNVLVLLGVLTIAGGALFGTGAFSQVEAQRSVDVDTAGDSGAQLGLSVDGDLAGSNNDTIAFELGSNGVNLDATTRFNGTLTVTNNGGNAVTLDVEDGSGNSILGSASTTSDMYFESQSGSNTISSGGGTVTYDVVFDTVGVTNDGNANIPDDVTIVAEE